MTKIVKVIALLGAALFVRCDRGDAMENTGRYFSFSSRPERSWYKKGLTLDLDLFYTSGQNIANDDASPIGIGEVAGRYDLADIVVAMDQAGLQTGEVTQLIGAQYAKRPLIFDIHGKVHNGGVVFRYAWALPGPLPITIGAALPVMQLESDLRYSLNQRNFIQQFQQTTPAAAPGIFIAPDEPTWLLYQERFDHARRVAHETMGFLVNHSKHTGTGDLDLFARINFVLDHRFLMRTLDFAIQYGVVAPTGFQRQLNEPSSIPAMHDGHWSMYAQFLPTFELKQDLKLGFMLRGQHFFAQTRERRLPVSKEPHFYSPLTGAVRVSPGSTFLVGGFLGLENLYDGMHLQAKYTYKLHHADQWSDVRDDKTRPSYLSRTVTPDISEDTKAAVISAKEYLSKFRSHYITIQLTYDPLEAGQALPLRPKCYVSFEKPMFDSSRGVLEANQITFGAELHF